MSAPFGLFMLYCGRTSHAARTGSSLSRLSAPVRKEEKTLKENFLFRHQVYRYFKSIARAIASRDRLFPFYGAGWLGGYIINNAVYALDLVDNSAGNRAKKFIWQGCPVGGHGVYTVHNA